MTEIELKKLSRNQLAKACRNQGLDSSGEKAALVNRLAVLEEVETEASGEGTEEGKEEPPPAD